MSYPGFVAVGPTLSTANAMRARALRDEIGDAFRDVQAVSFLEAAPLIAQDLPFAIRECVHTARVRERGSVLVIPARNIIGESRSPTPQDWREVTSPSATHRAEIFLVVIA